MLQWCPYDCLQVVFSSTFAVNHVPVAVEVGSLNALVSPATHAAKGVVMTRTGVSVASLLEWLHHRPQNCSIIIKVTSIPVVIMDLSLGLSEAIVFL